MPQTAVFCAGGIALKVKEAALSKLKNIPDGARLFYSIASFNHYAKDIDRIRETGDSAAERKAIADATYQWSGDVARRFKIDLKISGTENIPEEDGCVVIYNHQGYADIVALFRALEGKQIGFIAKDNLQKVPLFGSWIKTIRGLYIQRGNAKEALKSIQEGAELVKQGYNLVIFPEGTRSQGPEMGPFKAGSFKLATKAKAIIIPVSIDGTYHLYEENGHIRPATVHVMIHPPVRTADLSRKELPDMERQVEETIRAGLEILHKEDPLYKQ